MKKLLLPLASIALLAGLGTASATEPTNLDAATLDHITAGWNSSSNREERRSGGDRTTQNNNSFLSPQVNVAALNNISVLSFGSSQFQSVGQSNSNGNSISR
jgi:hypothetical protein